MKRLRPPDWLIELDGVDGITVKQQPNRYMTVSQKFSRCEFLLWGLSERDTVPEIRPAAFEALLRPKVIERRAQLEIERKKIEAERQKEVVRQYQASLSEEEKWELRAQRLDQPIKGTGHAPGDSSGWLAEDLAPTELVQYLEALMARGGFVKLRLRWPIRFDEIIRRIAGKYHRVIPENINFIKAEGQILSWGSSGSLTFDNPPETPLGAKIKEIVKENLTDDYGNPLKVVESKERTTVIGVHQLRIKSANLRHSEGNSKANGDSKRHRAIA
jgi:hypothetical protein